VRTRQGVGRRQRDRADGRDPELRQHHRGAAAAGPMSRGPSANGSMKAMAAMAKRTRISVRHLEQETKKFLAPSTEKEKAIIDAAIALIGERGVDGATTAEIARRANVTEKTLFRYFPSKQDLVRRVLYPLLLHVGLMRNWGAFEKLLRGTGAGFKQWYVALEAD